MFIRKSIVFAAFAAAAALAPAADAARVDVDVNIGPPAPIYEAVPPPRAGYAWAPGYWEYYGHRHHWHHGYWMRERRGYAWAPHRWEEQNGRWHMYGGRWERAG